MRTYLRISDILPWLDKVIENTTLKSIFLSNIYNNTLNYQA